jgi:fibronectin type 3 domain-containing protein
VGERSWAVQTTAKDSPIYLSPVIAGLQYEYRVRAVSRYGAASDYTAIGTHVVIGKTTPPSTPATMTATLENEQVLLQWASVPDLDLAEYEVRRGSSWDSSTFVGRARSTSLRVALVATGTTTWRVKAVDSIGLYSQDSASASFTLTAALAPVTTSSFSGDQVVLRWNAPISPLPIDFYEVRFGTTYASGTSLGTVKGTTFSTKAQFSGTRRFWVAAVDVNGNAGTAGSVDAVTFGAMAPTVTTQVVDNNVLLFWNEVQGALPTSTYEIRRGTTWESGSLVGTKSGIFTTVFETVAGTYTYWIAAVDTAGFYGTPGSVTTAVNQPPDYVLKLDNFTSFGGTKSNMAESGDGAWLIPVNTTETFAQHFTTRSWATPQAQVDAAFPIFIQPTLTTGYYEETIDAGALLAGSKVTVTVNGATVAGSITVSTRISLSANGSTWTDYNNTSSVFGTNFRYVKYRITVTGADTTSLYRIAGINLRIDSKLISDAGSATCSASDAGGTTVNFSAPFVDVVSIEVTPKGTTPVIAVYDFTDVPNPTSFKILLFTTSGTRTSGDVSWSAKGY